MSGRLLFEGLIESEGSSVVRVVGRRGKQPRGVTDRGLLPASQPARRQRAEAEPCSSGPDSGAAQQPTPVGVDDATETNPQEFPESPGVQLLRSCSRTWTGLCLSLTALAHRH